MGVTGLRHCGVDGSQQGEDCRRGGVMSEENCRKEVVFEDSTRKISFSLPNGNSFEINATKFIRIVKAKGDQDEGFLESLLDECPSAARFVELFAMLGVHAILAEVFVKGPK